MPPQSPASGPLLRLRKVTKRYPGVTANAAIDLDIWPGEVHVLLGENGAGKSTLVSLLSGFQRPDDGMIDLNGSGQALNTPQAALRAGISTVFQHSMLVPTLTLAENAALGGAWWAIPNRAKVAAQMAQTAARVGIVLNPNARTDTLSLGERQQAEIVRALMRGAKLLIFDEATAMLTPTDAAQLGTVMRRLAADGVAVIFITHKLNEALATADRITVLRSGRVAGTMSPREIRTLPPQEAQDRVVAMMFGVAPKSPKTTQPPKDTPPRPAGVPLPVTLACSGLCVTDAPVPLHDISFDIAQGEILGVAGMDGNGQKELAETLAGQRPMSAGHITIDGRNIDGLDRAARDRAGVRYVTDDRLGEGTVGSFSVAINLMLNQIGQSPYWTRGIAHPARINAHGAALIDAFNIRTPSPQTPVGKLSGGNIQKVLLARALNASAKAVIFAKPTYGLDLQNATVIRQRIRDVADQGCAVLLISTEIDELLDMADRILVLARGRVAAIVPNGPYAREQIARLISGGTL